MESQEIFPTPFCDDGTMPDDWPFLEWSKYFDQAASKHTQKRPIRLSLIFIDVVSSNGRPPSPHGPQTKAMVRRSWFRRRPGKDNTNANQPLDERQALKNAGQNVRSKSDRRAWCIHSGTVFPDVWME